MKDSTLRRATWRHHTVDREHDLPYLTGYSDDAGTLYIDRGVPERLEIEHDGRKKDFNLTHVLVEQAALEKALQDVMGWDFLPAHETALAASRRSVLSAGLPWRECLLALQGYTKDVDALTKVPGDLDLAPYDDSEVDGRLLAHLTKHRADQPKGTKEEAKYGADRGTSARHCGPVRQWRSGECKHFRRPAACTEVAGVIKARGLCDWWKE